MVYHCQYKHIYRCPFQQYLKVELERRLENDDANRTSIEVLEKARDPIDGNQRILLKTVWKNIIPDWLQQAAKLDIPEIEFEEEFWIDETDQGFWRRSRNVTLDDLFQIWQASTCSKDQNNENWTTSEEEGSVEVLLKSRVGVILENVIGKFIDKSIQTNIDDTEVNLVQFYVE